MTPEQLKASILQMAIQGKLVEQREKEGTADILLKFIRDKKENKMALGELKQEKVLPDIKEDEIPFDIPCSWRWVRLGDYCEKVTDQVASGSFASLRENVPSLKEPDYAIMVKTADFSNGFSANLTFTTQHGYEFLSNSNLFGGELILSNIGSIGKCFIVPNLGTKMTLAPNAIMLRLADDNYRDFLFYFIQSSQGYKELVEISSGTTMKKFNKTDLKKILIPVPPLEEQHRIVAKIEELLPFVDRYAASYEKLEQFNAKFPEDMKKSILQYAIKGKLVEQRPEEGTAEELYKAIQEEKQKLIKEGKIKKEKPLAEITEDEIPFDIPDSWKWVKLGDCTSYAQSKEKISPPEITNDMWSLDLEDIQKETGIILVKTLASERKISGDKVKFRKGQVLYSKLRPYLKKILVAPDDGICTPELVPFNVYGIDANYISYVLKSPHVDYIINTATYGVKMPRVGTDTMINLLIPLPPLEEQHRIVAKIEELLPYCDRLVK